MGVYILLFVVSMVWTMLSAAAVGFAVWGVALSKIEEGECRSDLKRLKQLGIGNGRLELAAEEYGQARRKHKVMHLFFIHQTLFLIVGVITLLIPSNPIGPTLTLFVIFRHLFPSFMLLTAQGLIVWGQVLLAVNVYRRQYLHTKYGMRDEG